MSDTKAAMKRPGRPRRRPRAEARPVRNGLVDQLRKAIAESDRSMSELADLAGVPTSAICRFKAGDRDILLGTAERIARLLGLRLMPAEGMGRRRKPADADPTIEAG